MNLSWWRKLFHLHTRLRKRFGLGGASPWTEVARLLSVIAPRLRGSAKFDRWGYAIARDFSEANLDRARIWIAQFGRTLFFGKVLRPTSMLRRWTIVLIWMAL